MVVTTALKMVEMMVALMVEKMVGMKV